MTTNVERIDRIEADLESLQDRISRMEFNDKLQQNITNGIQNQ